MKFLFKRCLCLTQPRLSYSCSFPARPVPWSFSLTLPCPAEKRFLRSFQTAASSCLEILRFNIGNLLSNFLETFAEIGVAMKIQGTQYLLLCRIIVMIYTVFVEICLALLRPANDSFLFLKLTKLSHLLLSTGTDFLGIGTCSIIHSAHTPCCHNCLSHDCVEKT